MLRESQPSAFCFQLAWGQGAGGAARSSLLPPGEGFSICKTVHGHGSGYYLQP